MEKIISGKFAAHLTRDAADIAAACELRTRAFRGPDWNGPRDADVFDARATHVLVHDRASGALVCAFRFLPFASGAEIGASYAAQFYDLSALESFEGCMVELGRFCTDPAVKDPNVLRAAWAAMTRYVDDNDVQLLFGCSSFAGTDTRAYAEAFALLAKDHIAPRRWRPRIKAPRVFEFAQRLARKRPNPARGVRMMPPLLRTYLAMGGWVSDHAVVDDHMDTLHVFTGVEVGRVPRARAERLRAVAARA